jgi:cell fate (sporulation/competence/biofilm development) regulator YmcA (YheA/YmcA/DUF963 family)
VAEGFEYETAIKDEASAPAKAMAGALDDLSASIRKNSDEMTKSVTAGELLADGFRKVAEAVVDVAKELGAMAFEGAKFAVEAAEFKENMVASYSIVLGTAEAGQAAFDQVQGMAIAAHAPVAEAAKLAQDLMLSGEKNADTISATVAAVSSLQRLGLGAGAEKLTRVIEQSESLGHFQLPKKLQGLGVTVDQLVGDLASRLGKSTAVIKDQLAHGKIATEVGVATLVDAINKGNVGAAAAKKFDLTGVWTDWKNAWTKIVQDIDTAPLIRGLRDFVSIFQDGTGSAKSMQTVVVDVLNTVIRWVGAAVDWVGLMALRFEIGFLKAEIAAEPLIEDMQKLGLHVGTLTDLGGAAEGLARGLTTVVIDVAWLLAHLEKLRETTEPMKVQGHEIGTGFIEGMVNGITGGQYGMIKAIHGLGEAGVEALRNIWKSHSPSQVAFELGEGIPEGQAQGIESGSARAASAIGAALRPPDFAGAAPAMGGGSKHIEFSPHIEIHAGSATDAHELADLVLVKITDTIGQINLEMGG